MAVPKSLFSLAPEMADAAGIISWVHIGDLHITEAGEQNHRDFMAIIDEVNEAFAGSVSFVYLPGDVANEGSAAEYSIVRDALERLKVPWCSILGDHDVQERSFANYLAYMAGEKHYAFEVGGVRFIALNAFDVPDPGCFCLLDEQLGWLEEEVRRAEKEGQLVVILMHCYPTDLKQGGARLREVIASPSVRLIDMGHTHYNELANDGRTLYAATRSTGQIEEGLVGFSVVNIDGGVVSWKFFLLHELPAVMITTPVDERLATEATVREFVEGEKIVVRAKVWHATEVARVTVTFQGRKVPMQSIERSSVWEVELDAKEFAVGVSTLTVNVETRDGRSAQDSIRFVHGAGAYRAPQRFARDQDNAVGAWPERGVLGTQLGPNKNGRKW